MRGVRSRRSRRHTLIGRAVSADGHPGAIRLLTGLDILVVGPGIKTG
jgi:hypothetical protein